MTRCAIVTGVTGMDGSLLSGQLLEKGYEVYGVIRRSSRGLDLGCSNHLPNIPNFRVVESDLLDVASLTRLCKQARADYFYNMASQSHVGTSFEQPTLTAQVTGVGVLNCLEAIRLSGIFTRFLTASSSEMFGGVSDEPANESTTFSPQSPYACSKMFGYWITKVYRTSYKMFACNSICFNHECGFRGPNFVTRKITQAVARIKAGKQQKLFLGNLEARRDWGWAPEFCRGMQLILESSTPDDFVLATGEGHSVREFCGYAFKYVGLDYRDYVEIDPVHYRPAEVNVLIGDYSKAKRVLGWEPTVTFQGLVEAMVQADLRLEGISLD